MTDNGNSKKLTLLTVLVAVLLAAVVAQSVAVLGLRKELRSASGDKESTPVAVVPDDDQDAGTAFTLPQSPFDSDPFDWDLDEWDPFKEMHAMHDRINQMFGNAYNRFQDSDDFGSLFGAHAFSPSVNIEDKGDRYLVTVDLPGAEESHLDVKLEGQALTISGTVTSETRDEDEGKMLRQERRSGQFRRTVTLPSPVQADKMTTENKKGILRIEIPKANVED